MKRFLMANLSVVFLATQSYVLLAKPLHVIRCHEEDWLGHEEAKGRIAWAQRCGFVDDYDTTFFERKNKYPSFSSEDGKRFKAPTKRDDSCEGWYEDYIVCNIGCYTPEQRILSSGVYIPIEKAFETEESFVNSLTENSDLNGIEIQDSEIESFIVGDTKETVFLFTTDQGKKIRVTSNHPLVLSDGLVKAAADIKEEDSLLGVVEDSAFRNVQAEKILSIETQWFEGNVYNLQPVSEKEIENIIIAEGLLNGSNRFQNEWSEREFRIRMRTR